MQTRRSIVAFAVVTSAAVLSACGTANIAPVPATLGSVEFQAYAVKKGTHHTTGTRRAAPPTLAIRQLRQGWCVWPFCHSTPSARPTNVPTPVPTGRPTPTPTAVPTANPGAGTIEKVQQEAYGALVNYQALNQTWQNTSDDNQKDQIEMQMVTALGTGVNNIRNLTKGANDSQLSQIYQVANTALTQYAQERSQYQATNDVTQMRNISNQMMQTLGTALKTIQGIQ